LLHQQCLNGKNYLSVQHSTRTNPKRSSLSHGGTNADQSQLAGPNKWIITYLFSKCWWCRSFIFTLFWSLCVNVGSGQFQNNLFDFSWNKLFCTKWNKKCYPLSVSVCARSQRNKTNEKERLLIRKLFKSDFVSRLF
jgi:hypothetical protein